MTQTARDIWIPPIVINASNNGIRVNENGVGGVGVITTTIAAGTYYLHNDTTLTDYPSFYDAVATALNASANGVFSFSTRTPTQSTGQTLAGLRIKNSLYDFEIDFGHSSFEHDARWYGWRIDKGSLSASNVISSTSTALDSDYTVLGRWYSAGYVDNISSRKQRDYIAITEYSTSNPATAASVRWDLGKTRSFLYEFVPGPHVYGYKAEDASAASIANLATDDALNGFDLVWGALNYGRSVIVVYNASSPTLGVSTLDYEVVKLAEKADTLRKIAKWSVAAADLYTLEFSVRTLSGNYETLAEGDYL